MVRKKVTIGWIANGSARKASLRKRRAGLVKKVSELSTLCDVDAFIIIYSPDERKPVVWPSCSKVQEMMTRFDGISKMERNKKVMNQETYLNERVSKLQDKLKKHDKKHKEMVFSNLMHYVYECNGLDELGVTDLHSLVWFVEEKRMEINRRIEYCQQLHVSHGSLPHVLCPFAAPTHDPNIGDNIDVSVHDHHEKALVESDSYDQRLMDMMNNSENIVRSSIEVKSNHMVGLSAVGQPFVESSNGGNQLGLVGHANYKPYFGGPSGTETIVGLQHTGNLEAISSGRSDMPMLLPAASVQDSDNIGNYSSSRLQHYRGYKGLDTSGSDMAIMLALPDSESSGSRGDIAFGMQAYRNIQVNNSVSEGFHKGFGF